MFYETLGLSSNAVEVLLLQGYGATSLDNWCPKFQDHYTALLSDFKREQLELLLDQDLEILVDNYLRNWGFWHLYHNTYFLSYYLL
jgi:hypothetical protein